MDDHTFEGQWVQTQERLGQQERRSTPPRLSASGMQVTNWDDAQAQGFYYSAAGALNAPNLSGVFTGMVQRTPSRIVQEVSDTTTIAGAVVKTWRRVYAGSSWGPWIELSSQFPASGISAAAGFGIYFNHPSGTPAGAPTLLVSNGMASLRATLRNESGSPISVSAGRTLATGLVASAIDDFGLTAYSVMVSFPGPLRTEFGVVVRSSGALVARGPAYSIPAGDMFEVVGVYPVAG